ncbi:Glutathione transport system permease protein GsiD [Roseobacter fucihabitans]|uniref:Glutathione transport system permease protein GsiD n=1 Tax=Roseobacter fucihabitans TaxID=1537242 RepID=A0ABZ2BQV2_9RHOB|nr:ABC transporter permease [Roseobacter litoralis]MBC6968213.1 Glutathione transport system permease protein GsiD [Roseobacter litoralis]
MTSKPLAQTDTFSAPERSNFARAMRRLMRHRSGQIGGVIVLTLVFCAIMGETILPYDPLKIDPINRLQEPSAEHWFGTDELGRDLFSRIVYGSRYTLLIGLVSTAIAASFGITLGLLAGAGGKLADMLIMRVVDVLLAFPYILLLLAVIAILGPSLWTAMIAVGVGGIAGYARLIRGEVLALRDAEFVEAQRALGAGHLRILFGTILPNVTSQIVIYASFTIPLAVLAAAALSFLGLGAQPPAPEWGSMLVDARTFLRTAWWVVAAPGLAIFVSIFGMNLFGNALRDVLDPKEMSK